MDYRANITIDAPKSLVWSVLLDTAHWPDWDPYCEKIEGHVALGEKIKAFTTLSPGRAFPVKVVELTENERMVWVGGMPFGLFKGVRTFTLEDSPAKGQVSFTLTEVFSGPMLRLIGRSIPDMTDPFQKFVNGLKRQCETQTS